MEFLRPRWGDDWNLSTGYDPKRGFQVSENEEQTLLWKFKKLRRRQVLIAFVGSFLLWYFFGGRQLLPSFVISIFVAIGRWFFFTRNLR